MNTDEQFMLPLGKGPLESWRERFDDCTYPSGFWDWLEDNMHIFDAFVKLALRTQRRGVQRWSADAICHVLRWQTAMRERGQDILKINNNATAGLARLARELHPSLREFLVIRQPPASSHARRFDGNLYTEASA